MNSILLGFKRMFFFLLYILAFPGALMFNFFFITIPDTIKEAIEEYKNKYLNSEESE